MYTSVCVCVRDCVCIYNREFNDTNIWPPQKLQNLSTPFDKNPLYPPPKHWGRTRVTTTCGSWQSSSKLQTQGKIPDLFSSMSGMNLKLGHARCNGPAVFGCLARRPEGRFEDPYSTLWFLPFLHMFHFICKLQGIRLSNSQLQCVES